MFCWELYRAYGKPLATTRLKGYMGSYIWIWGPFTFHKNCKGHTCLTPKSPSLPNAPKLHSPCEEFHSEAPYSREEWLLPIAVHMGGLTIYGKTPTETKS